MSENIPIIKEVAEHKRIAKQTMYSLAQRSKILYFKDDDQGLLSALTHARTEAYSQQADMDQQGDVMCNKFPPLSLICRTLLFCKPLRRPKTISQPVVSLRRPEDNELWL